MIFCRVRGSVRNHRLVNLGPFVHVDICSVDILLLGAIVEGVKVVVVVLTLRLRLCFDKSKELNLWWRDDRATRRFVRAFDELRLVPILENVVCRGQFAEA